MKELTIFTHGESKNNPGPAAIGAYVIDEKGDVVKEVSESIGNATNSYAEYFAVVRGLQEVRDLFEEKTLKMKVELKLDSEMVKNHLCAKEQIKDVSLIGHFVEIYNLRVANFPELKVTLIKPEHNKESVRLTKEVG